MLCGPATAGGASQCHEAGGSLCAGMATPYSFCLMLIREGCMSLWGDLCETCPEALGKGEGPKSVLQTVTWTSDPCVLGALCYMQGPPAALPAEWIV